MNGERGSFEKFFSGFALWRARAFGKFLYVAVIVALVIGAYHRLFLVSPVSTRIEKVDTLIQPPENKKAVFLGIKFWRVGVGVYVE